MKLKLFGLLSLMGLLLGACASDNEPSGTGSGEIKASFKANYQVRTTGSTDGGTANAAAPDIADFMVHLKKSDGSYDKTWSSIAVFPTDNKFTTGAYQMDISYGNINEEGFDKPYYYGSTTFNVIDEEQAAPQIEATLANTMVKVNYTDAFKQYFTDYSTKIHSAGGDYITFAKDEIRPAYVKPGTISMQVTLTKSNGTTFTFEPAAIENALAKTLYNITFDVNGGEVGAAVLKITFDDATLQAPVNIDLSGDILNTPAPYMTSAGYDSNTAISMVEGDDTQRQASCTMIAHSGLSSIVLTTESEYLISKGWPAEVDLMKATEAQKALFKQYGLDVKGAWVNPDKMALVDFSGLLPNLRPLNGNSTHKFTLQVKDVFTRVCENPVVLTVNAPAAVFALSSPESSAIGTTEASFTTTYNSSNINKNVSFKAYNDYGTWVDAPIVKSELVSANTYHVTVKVPDNSTAIKLYGNYKDFSQSNEITLPRTTPPYTLVTTEDYNTWAHTTKVKIVPQDAQYLSALMDHASVYIQTGSGEYAETKSITKNSSTGEITITGLAAGTTYNIKTSMDGTSYCTPIAIATETAAQVTNAAMEDWYSYQCYSGKVTWVGIPCYEWQPKASATASDYWATRNTMTTSQRAGASCYYTCFSGTVSATGVTGNAAEIRTVGWGEGNTFLGYINSSIVIKNKTAGMMFMGSYSYSNGTETFNYGRPFTSRPTSLTFSYKYHSVNSEGYKAYVVVENRSNGTVEIGRGEISSSTETVGFNKVTVPITYSRKDLKATHMYIVFISSTASSPEVECVKGSNSAFYGYSDSSYQGSKLTVDDITLNY